MDATLAKLTSKKRQGGKKGKKPRKGRTGQAQRTRGGLKDITICKPFAGLTVRGTYKEKYGMDIYHGGQRPHVTT